MPTLREKMKEEMTLVGLSESTQKIYLNAVIRLNTHYQKSPAYLTTQEIRDYLLYLLKEKKLSPNTYNTHAYALRFFYMITLRQPLRKLDLPATKVTYKLPSILSADEVKRIIQATGNLKQRTLLMVIYGAGLRVSEAVKLRINDIDRARMTLHIRCSKGGKDRYVVLSPVVLRALICFWKNCPFDDYIFTSQRTSGKPMTTANAAHIFKLSKAKAGVTKAGGIHSLRHAFATHLLELGTDIFAIKEWLGHASIQSTVRYLAFVPSRYAQIQSPIEHLNLS